MTTATTERSFSEWLRDARGERSKAQAARDLEVSWMTFDMWEKGAWVPDLQYAERLARFAESELPPVVWMLYRQHVTRAKGVYRSSLSAALIPALNQLAA